MSKLIIDNRSQKPDELVVFCALQVVRQGRISNDGKDYCYATTFPLSQLAIYSRRNKSSETLIVVDAK